ncbi:unnamed protein product [Ixodes pacificus]
MSECSLPQLKLNCPQTLGIYDHAFAITPFRKLHILRSQEFLFALSHAKNCAVGKVGRLLQRCNGATDPSDATAICKQESVATAMIRRVSRRTRARETGKRDNQGGLPQYAKLTVVV